MDEIYSRTIDDLSMILAFLQFVPMCLIDTCSMFSLRNYLDPWNSWTESLELVSGLLEVFFFLESCTHARKVPKTGRSNLKLNRDRIDLADSYQLYDINNLLKERCLPIILLIKRTLFKAQKLLSPLEFSKHNVLKFPKTLWWAIASQWTTLFHIALSCFLPALRNQCWKLELQASYSAEL